MPRLPTFEGASHQVSRRNVSRTFTLNLRTKRWKELLTKFPGVTFEGTSRGVTNLKKTHTRHLERQALKKGIQEKTKQREQEDQHNGAIAIKSKEIKRIKNRQRKQTRNINRRISLFPETIVCTR